MIDFRSDTVTRPTPEMRQAMAGAEVGDDVFGDDPTVLALEQQVGELLGKEAAVFVPTGTQSNLVGLLAHCQRGDEYIVGQNAHTYKYEGGGAAVLGSIQPQPIDAAEDGTLPLESIARKIKPDDCHYARTQLIAIENTYNGQVLPTAYLDSLRPFADEHGLALHLDGARLWNAAAALECEPADLAKSFDTVSVCFSKGLGAPLGSALVGSADLVNTARRWRKVLGGGMRQCGIVAAAAIHALDHHRDRMREDHRRASLLAERLDKIDGFSVKDSALRTNMVFVSTDHDPHTWQTHLESRGILIRAGVTTRLVTHLDVSDADIQQLVDDTERFVADSHHTPVG